MKRITILLIFTIVSLWAQAQGSIATVYLKNGSIVKGRVVEYVSGESVKVSTADGSLFVFRMDEVERLDMGQTPSRRMVRSGYKLLIDGQMLPDEQLAPLLGRDNFATYQSASRQFKKGRAMVRWGWALAGLTVISAAMTPATEGVSLLATYPCAVLADILLPIGYIRKGIGKGRLNWLADTYNAGQLVAVPAPSFRVSPVLATLPGGQQAVGMGLVLRF
ncbi:MAG: hypothetical protein IJU72_05710 [Bacteroidales bacterium]|nr:hypothetical protein [Bacteroidales bacterium]